MQRTKLHLKGDGFNDWNGVTDHGSRGQTLGSESCRFGVLLFIGFVQYQDLSEIREKDYAYLEPQLGGHAWQLLLIARPQILPSIG